MLTIDDKLTIYKEAILDKPPSITTDEALEYRKQKDLVVNDARSKGLILEVPNELM